MKKVKIITQGCKVNLLDSEIIMNDLAKHGFKLTDENNNADVIIINSCTVTKKADLKFLQIIKKIKKNNPNVLLCGVGCYTELNKKDLVQQPFLDIILGSSDKFEISNILLNKLTQNQCYLTSKERESYSNKFYDYESIDFTKHTRAFLKIQDGCDNYCTYCTIPYARGKSRSRNPNSIIKDVQTLANKGYKEIVLSGICLGSYKFKAENETIDFPTIIKEILKISGFRLRIGSIEPWCFTPQLIELLVKEERICPHFHLPLQVASNIILKLMNRNYTLKDYLKIIEKLSARKNLHISSDLIVGFPGESELDFQEGIDFIKKSKINSLHVFSYSDRPLAKSSTYPSKISNLEIKKRSKLARNLAASQKLKFIREQKGYILQVLVEKINHKNNEVMGYSENYLPVIITLSSLQINFVKKGNIYKCRVKDILFNNSVFTENSKIVPSFDDELILKALLEN